jgi:uncharacterized repeat protein (TIGR01451 family)
MARKSPSGLAGFLHRFVRGLFKQDQSRSELTKRHLRFEPLEGRALLASDLAAITGVVTLQNNPVEGAQVNLWQDDGDGLFDDQVDTPIESVTTTAGGVYRFDRLPEGDYFVEQIAQTAGSVDLGRFVTGLIPVSALQAEGTDGTEIDNFADPQQVIQADSGTPIASDATDHAGALGGERDLIAELTQGGSGQMVILDSQMGRLQFTSSVDAQGRFTAIYDGDDDDGDTLDPTGLGGVDLTNSDTTNFLKLRVRANQANTTVKVRIHTDATHFSESDPFTIPGTAQDTVVVFAFDPDDFTALGSAGGADFTSVGAIEVIAETGTNGTSGQIDVLGTFGEIEIEQDIVNEADLTLTKVLETPSPNVGSQVTFTITLVNSAAGAGATNIVVEDILPTGLAFVSADPSTGTYDDETGLWTIPSLAAGAGATLEIVATLNSSAAITNSAEVVAADQNDPTSTPDDGEGDDFDSVLVDAPAAADLSVNKTVSSNSPALNSNVTFTVTLTNSGPDQATNIVVTDQLPTGLTYVSDNPEVGTYDEGTGLWTVASLNSGESVMLQIVATVTSSDPLQNTATITDSDQFDPDTADNEESETVDVPESADLSVDIGIDDATPNVGQQVTLTVTVANGGPGAAGGVVVTPVLPAGLTLVSSNPSVGTFQGGVWTVGSIASGADETLELVVTVASSAAINVTAQVTAATTPDPDSTPNDGTGDDFDSLTIDAPAAANLSLDKTVNNATPNVGQQVTFTLTLSNSGPDAATGIAVTDQLPAGLTLISSNASTGTFTLGTGIWTVPTLASGATATLSLVARVDSSAALTNSAQVTAVNEFDPNSTPNDGTGDDFDSVGVDAPAAADLSLDLQVNNATPNLNGQVTFTLTLTNGGPDQATGVVVTDLLPSGLSFVSANTATGAYTSNNGQWAVGDLASGATATLTVVATVTSTAQITNTAQVTASGVFDPDSTPNDGAGDDFDSVQVDAVAAADLSVDVTTSSATPNFGSNVTFTITLANAGPDQATNVVVTDLLPSGLVFVSASPSIGTYNPNNGQWTVAALNSGANATLSLIARVNSTAQITNVAEVTAAGTFDPDSSPNDGQGDDRDTVQVDAPAAADLKLSKSASTTSPGVGQQVTFTITVTNDGPDAATNVAVTDLLPAGLSFVSSTQSQGAYASGTGIWTVGTINSGATATLTLVATNTVAGSKTNVAQVTASDQFDPDSTPGDNTGDDRASTTIGETTTKISKRRFLARNSS